MSFRSAFVAALLATVNAHMIMESPVPFSVDKIDSSPITADQFPCKSQLGFTVSKMNSMAVGQKQTISFKGSAVHGGGSCQLSVTTDTTPTKNSKFKVIKSIEGGCPGINGPSTFDFTLPSSIPNGKATFAWTWFSKLSGAPELYMNCAPIEVTGGASDSSAFNALPDMLVANIASTTCKSPESKALKFPNPGTVLQMGDDGSDVADPTGSCGSSSGGTTPAQSSPSAGQPSTPQSSAASQPSAPAAQPSTPSNSSGAAPSPAASQPGGVFAPGASSAAGVPAQTSTTLVTVTATPQPSAPASPDAGSPAQSGTAAAPAASAAPVTGGGSSSTCSTNGAVVCNGTTQFGLCNNGNVVWQAVAAGTTCSNGVISKRESRVRRARYSSPKIAKPIGY